MSLPVPRRKLGHGFFSAFDIIAVMTVYLGADHRGFALKGRLAEFLKDQGHEVVDCGAAVYDAADDYPDFAAEVARQVSRDPAGRRGVVICGSGGGVGIVANKLSGVRAVLGLSGEQVSAIRRDEDANVLALASDFTSPEDAEKMLHLFLSTPFSGEERHKRRLAKISAIEER